MHFSRSYKWRQILMVSNVIARNRYGPWNCVNMKKSICIQHWKQTYNIAEFFSFRKQSIPCHLLQHHLSIASPDTWSSQPIGDRRRDVRVSLEHCIGVNNDLANNGIWCYTADLWQHLKSRLETLTHLEWLTLRFSRLFWSSCISTEFLSFYNTTCCKLQRLSLRLLVFVPPPQGQTIILAMSPCMRQCMVSEGRSVSDACVTLSNAHELSHETYWLDVANNILQIASKSCNEQLKEYLSSMCNTVVTFCSTGYHLFDRGNHVGRSIACREMRTVYYGVTLWHKCLIPSFSEFIVPVHG